MKYTAIALFSVFVGCLGAQSTESKTTTTTTSTPVNLDGTLVDQGCYTTHSRSKESNTDPATTTTTTTVTTKETTECPVTTTTKTFGLLTPDGKVVRFDDAGNTRVIQMMKSDKDFSSEMNDHRPVKVRVVAMPNGDVMVIKEIKADKQ